MFSRLNRGDSPYKVADFLELQCIKSGGTISSLSYRSYLSMPDDEIDNEGIESSDDASVSKLDAAIAECSNRYQCCPNHYPFVTGTSSLDLRPEDSWHKDIYTFLLLATRMNMRDNREQGGYDGTQLFEQLCAIVTKEYYGRHCNARVFGTAASGSFSDKVEELLRSLNIRGHFTQPDGSTGREKDGNLDIVAWIPFSDKKDGQMIALGQCKTGTHWEGMLTELDPEVFFSLYSSQQPYSKPLKMFFVAESFGKYKWGERSSNGGVLFDRTRIMEFLPDEVNEEMAELLSKIKTWNKAALAAEYTEEDE